MPEIESKTKWIFLIAFFIAIILFGTTTIDGVWILILTAIIFCLLAISPLNTGLVKFPTSIVDETKDTYEFLLFLVIGIAIAYGILGRIF